MSCWDPPPEVKAALREGLAVVHRKHKRRQATIGPCHAAVDELFAVIEGQLEIMAHGTWYPAPPRAFVYIPNRTHYAIRQKRGHAGHAHIINVLFRAPARWR